MARGQAGWAEGKTERVLLSLHLLGFGLGRGLRVESPREKENILNHLHMFFSRLVDGPVNMIVHVSLFT